MFHSHPHSLALRLGPQSGPLPVRDRQTINFAASALGRFKAMVKPQYLRPANTAEIRSRPRCRGGDVPAKWLKTIRNHRGGHFCNGRGKTNATIQPLPAAPSEQKFSQPSLLSARLILPNRETVRKAIHQTVTAPALSAVPLFVNVWPLPPQPGDEPAPLRSCLVQA